MKLLDLFCGAGGAAMGYHRAGFDDIVGVDNVRQFNYPFQFVYSDALEPDLIFRGYDLIHASPPCQAYSTLRHSPGADTYPDLIAPTRALLQASGVPYVIENVRGAPLLNPTVLCGSSFGLRHDGYELRRHRLFETSFAVLAPPCDHRSPVLGVYGDLSKTRRKSIRGVKAGHEDAKVLMGIDWMTPSEISQAIPPAFTEYLGRQFLDQLTRV